MTRVEQVEINVNRWSKLTSIEKYETVCLARKLMSDRRCKPNMCFEIAIKKWNEGA